MNKNIWTDRARSEEVLRGAKKGNEKKEDQLGWCRLCRNYVLKHVIEGKVRRKAIVTGRRERRHKQLLGCLKENRGYCKLKEESLDRTLWRTRFGSGYGVLNQQNE
jgi:hypothetical protein